MSKRKKQNNPNLVLIMVIIIALLVGISVLIKMNNNKNGETQKADKDVSISQEKIAEYKSDEELEKIKSMNERTRIEYYISNYMKLLEEQNYDKAYSLLNKTYKNNYFKTQKEFEEYCEKNFPIMMNITYDNFERNGEIYVIWITVTDAIRGSKEAGKEINFVVKENTFNDYELSFSKI